MAASNLKKIGIDLEVSRIIEAHRRSFRETENTILRRLLFEHAKGAKNSAISAVTQLDPPRFGSRNRGHWQVKFGNAVVAGANLKDAYCNLLLLAHRQDKRFLEQFATYKARSRHYVARSGEGLYLASPALARKHAIELVPGWYADGNLSEDQVAKRARTAALVCGLTYGSEVWIKERGRTI